MHTIFLILCWLSWFVHLKKSFLPAYSGFNIAIFHTFYKSSENRRIRKLELASRHFNLRRALYQTRRENMILLNSTSLKSHSFCFFSFNQIYRTISQFMMDTLQGIQLFWNFVGAVVTDWLQQHRVVLNY